MNIWTVLNSLYSKDIFNSDSYKLILKLYCFEHNAQNNKYLHNYSISLSRKCNLN